MALTMMIKKNYKFWTFLLCFMFAFSLLYAVQINVPIHSDDYRYLHLGGDVKALLDNYLTWSGRLVADLIASSILSLEKPVYSALNSLALSVFLLLTTLLPSYILNSKLKARDALNFCILFFVYWIANTNLGQTTFWIVGSANYLWTNLFIVIFLFLFTIFTNRNTKYYFIPIAFLFSYIAGATNENTGWLAFIFVLFRYWHCNPQEKGCLSRILYASGVIGGLFGWLTLLLSPGNYKRSQYPDFQGWYSRTIYERIDIHLYERLPNYLSDYIFVFILITIILAVLLSYSSLDDESFSINKHINRMTSNILIHYVLFFILCGILSGVLLVGAPYIAARVGNGTLCQLLLALAFTMHAFSRTSIKSSTKVIFYSTILIFTSSYFLTSYYLVYSAFKKTHAQEQIRNSIIMASIQSNSNEAIIPEFYFSRLLKESDRFDPYHNGWEMARYFGGNLNDDKQYPIAINYGAIIDNDDELFVNTDIAHDLTLHRVILYSEPTWPITKLNQFILFEFNASPHSKIQKQDKLIFFHIYRNDGSFLNADVGKPHAIKIGSKFYYARKLSEKILINDVKSINFGVFDNTGRDSNFVVNY